MTLLERLNQNKGFLLFFAVLFVAIAAWVATTFYQPVAFAQNLSATIERDSNELVFIDGYFIDGSYGYWGDITFEDTTESKKTVQRYVRDSTIMVPNQDTTLKDSLGNVLKFVPKVEKVYEPADTTVIDTTFKKQTVLVVAEHDGFGNPINATYWVYDTTGMYVEGGPVKLENLGSKPRLTFTREYLAKGHESSFTGETGKVVAVYNPYSAPPTAKKLKGGKTAADRFLEDAQNHARGTTPSFWNRK